jgi:hypothetical protein
VDTTGSVLPIPDLEALPRNSRGRFWLGVLVGLVVSLPIAWLLSYGALLPFYIGVFFFALFGLVLGAVVYRIASPARPHGRWTVLAGTTVLVAACWGFSIIKESRDFPQDMARDAVRRSRDLGGRTATQYRDEVAEAVRGFLKERYPPGGTFGYVRWMLVSSEIRKNDLPHVDFTLRRPQGRWGWAIRVVLSLGLLAFGVASQTFLLMARGEAAVAATD